MSTSNAIGAVPILSLFCGPGGMDEGFRQGGYRTVIAVDIDRRAVETVQHNHPDSSCIVADVSRLSGRTLASIIDQRPAVDRPRGVIGGPPCQGFSSMNAERHAGDERNLLPFHYARLLRYLNRRYEIDFFVFENVTGILQKRHRASFELALQYFEQAGFLVNWDVLDAYHFGVPQVRRRVFVVGLNQRFNRRFAFPPTTPERRTVFDALWAVPAQASTIYHPNHHHMVPRSPKFGQIKAGDTSRKSFKRLAWDQPSPTVAYGHNEVHLHPEANRRLSVLEAMLLQGFPMAYEIKGTMSDQFRLVSEAVSPPVAAVLAQAITAQLEEGAAEAGAGPTRPIQVRWF